MAHAKIVVVLALLTVGVYAAPKACQSPTKAYVVVTGGPKQDLTHFMATMDDSLSLAATKVMDKNPEFKKLLTEYGKECQLECAGDIMKEVAKMWYGTKAVSGSGAGAMDRASQSITGALMACYPTMAHGDMMGVAKTMVDLMGGPVDASKIPEIKVKSKCPGQPPKADQEMAKAFTAGVKELPKQFGKSLAKFPELKKYLNEGVFQCQNDCSDKTIGITIINLWKSGRFGQTEGNENAIKALTGSLKACYPSVPRKKMLAFVTDVIQSMPGRRLQEQLVITV